MIAPMPRRKAAAKAEPAPPEPVAEPAGEEAGSEPVLVPAANNDTLPEKESGEPRRGWWQRTFG